MGYQVGNVCYGTKGEAENAYFSAVVPVVSTSVNAVPTGATIGRFPPSYVNSIHSVALIKPDYINGKWQLNGKVISANLPQCSPLNNFKDGAQIGGYFLVAAIALWGVMLLSKFLWNIKL